MNDVHVRLWIVDDSLADSQFWDNELYPTDSSGRRSTEEWAREHFQSCDVETLREAFNLPKEGDFQVLGLVKMVSESPQYPCEEWDEWFEVVESKYAPIPPKFFDCGIDVFPD